MVESSISDLPLSEIVAKAKEIIKRGGITYQKFTCSTCGSRQTIDVPNSFYTEGSCQECGMVTNIREVGCGFLAIFNLKEG